MAKHKIQIPVVVTKNGAIQTGSFWRHNDGKGGSQYDFVIDGFNNQDYETGYQVVTVEAEIDVDALFKDHTVAGSVSR
jgi:hypothetical protein